MLARFTDRHRADCPVRSDIRSEVFEFAMGQTEAEGGFGSSLCRIVEDIADEYRHQQRTIVRSRAPTDCGANKVGQVTDCERLRMAAIAPIGIEITQRAVF